MEFLCQSAKLCIPTTSFSFVILSAVQKLFCPAQTIWNLMDLIHCEAEGKVWEGLNFIMSGLLDSPQYLSICLLSILHSLLKWFITCFEWRFKVWPSSASQMHRSAVQSSGVPVSSRKETFCQSRRSRKMTLGITPVKSSLVALWSGGRLNSWWPVRKNKNPKNKVCFFYLQNN